MVEQKKDLPSSYLGTEVLGKVYDLINIDFESEHPAVDLVRMVQENFDELVTRTDERSAEFIACYVNEHIARCQCPNKIEADGLIKFY